MAVSKLLKAKKFRPANRDERVSLMNEKKHFAGKGIKAESDASVRKSFLWYVKDYKEKPRLGIKSLDNMRDDGFKYVKSEIYRRLVKYDKQKEFFIDMLKREE